MTLSTPFRLELPRAIYDAMIEQARAELPNECCGLLAGGLEEGVAQVVRCFPLVNEAASPREYRAVSGLGEANRQRRESGLEFVAVYHSHPTSPPIPSKTDLAEFYWDGHMSLIISLAEPEPEMRGWWLTNTDYREAERKLL